ncbi:unnamed protein product [Mesocestoides corti]|uniref:Sas10 C-terminal domain-containing protein n=1 Tax=Mesocestoides corti TaxID=53468 RepID=A0A0R3UEE3_MESCO|nr:unnamed protein product [Mesocestoides corti]
MVKDCHQRQSALYSIHPAPHSPVAFFLSPLSKGELLYTSGQSRLHLHLRENTPAQRGNIDYLIFKRPVTNVCQVPKFPSTLDEEAVAFRSHGLPLLVWPRNRDKPTVQKYLDDNYPDCGKWFRELDKCQGWLKEKWTPLAAFLGLELPSSLNPPKEKKVLLDFPPDCVAATYIKERIAWLCDYCSLLESYLVHRRIATPGFHHNPIHYQLNAQHEERLQAVANDSGFFNVAGDRLLQLGKAATAEGRQVRLQIHEMAKTIADSQKRAQFLSVLLPMADLKDALSHNQAPSKNSSKNGSFSKARAALLEALEEDSSEEEPDQVENSADEEEMDVDDTESDAGQNHTDKPKELPAVNYPNRPVSKEIMDNRGIVKYRHKRERNPRVHLRYKYKKAQIRYKSRVPNVRKEDAPYAGELRGIRVNMIKSHKFKKPR